MYNIVKLKKAEQLLRFLSPWESSPRTTKANGFSFDLSGLVFRGQSNADFKLIPSALRKNNHNFFLNSPGRKFNINTDIEFFQILTEFYYLREFYRKSNSRGLRIPYSEPLKKSLHLNKNFEESLLKVDTDIWLPNDLHEIAALAQHYGIPTRLLDWTYDPLVALYFSLPKSRDIHLEDANGKFALFALNKEKVSKKINEIVFVNADYSKNPNLFSQRGLFTLVTTKYSGLRNEVFAESIRNNDIASIQKTSRSAIDDIISNHINKGSVKKDVMWKFTLPYKEAEKIKSYLNQLDTTTSRFFPGFDGVKNEIFNM